MDGKYKAEQFQPRKANTEAKSPRERKTAQKRAKEIKRPGIEQKETPQDLAPSH